MQVYVMRHGTTVWNEMGVTQGRTNNKLSRDGVRLTQEVAENFKDVHIDLIVSSPLMRTMQTAKIMNQYHNVKIVKDNNLIEIDQGIFSGRSKESLTEEELVMKKNRSKEAGMENYQECLGRAEMFVESIKEKYNYENILVVTHNICASFIKGILNNEKVDICDERKRKCFNNAEIKRFTWK